MAIFNPVMYIVSEIIGLHDFIKSPLLCLGVQDIEKSLGEGVIPDEFKFDTLGELLRKRGILVDELDPFDNRALLKWNLNNSVPEEAWEKYATIIDYGCIEHIFDTRMVLENCMRMLRVGGLYFIHTPVRNFANHGLHTFSSEMIPRVMQTNRFEVIYERYTTSSGRNVDIESDENTDVIGWYVGKKMKKLSLFISPEQKRYAG
jgi:hypothetical protein